MSLPNERLGTGQQPPPRIVASQPSHPTSRQPTMRALSCPPAASELPRWHLRELLARVVEPADDGLARRLRAQRERELLDLGREELEPGELLDLVD